MPGNSGGNKSARLDNGRQPWFNVNLAKRRKKNKAAKQARKRNRRR